MQFLASKFGTNFLLPNQFSKNKAESENQSLFELEIILETEMIYYHWI